MANYQGCSCNYCHERDHGSGRRWSPSRYFDAKFAVNGLSNISKVKAVKSIDRQIIKLENTSKGTKFLSNYIIKPVLRQVAYQGAIALATTFMPPAVPIIILANYAISYGPMVRKFSTNLIGWSQTGRKRYVEGAEFNASNMLASKPIDMATNSTIGFLEKQAETNQSETSKRTLSLLFEQVISPIISSYTSNTVTHITKVFFLPK